MSPQAPPRLRTICVKEIEMATIEVKKVEEQLNNRLLFSVHVNADEGHIEIPIEVKDRGSPAANEAAAVASTLAFAEALEAAARLRLGLRAATEKSDRDTPAEPVRL